MTTKVLITICLVLVVFSVAQSSDQQIQLTFATHIDNASSTAIGEEIVQEGIVVSQDGPQINGV